MATERCECCGEGKDPVNETETAWQCNDCEQWNPSGETDAFGFRDDQRLDGTSADAAAYRRNSWMFG
jgi:hypothetical protein